MDRIPQFPPPIEPLLNQGILPLWSVMIPVYNCAGFLKLALDSVLAQDLGPDQMQIEVVDDASTDADIEELVKLLGNGRVNYFCQPQNVGNLRNFETCLNRSQGKLVHLVHGDDLVRPGFYSKFTELFERFPQAGAAFCNHYHINEKGHVLYQMQNEIDQDGILQDWLYKIAKNQRLQYISIVVKRSVYEHLGSFYGVSYGEDWEMWVRIARYYPVVYTPQILAEYRHHTNSISSQKLLNGQILRDLSFVINNNGQYLPENRRKEILSESRKIWAFYGIELAYEIWYTTRNYQGIKKMIQETLRLNMERHVVWEISKLLIKIVLKIGGPKSRYS